jgi:hypothetical protein
MLETSEVFKTSEVCFPPRHGEERSHLCKGQANPKYL